jgi:hypothetical protein
MSGVSFSGGVPYISLRLCNAAITLVTPFWWEKA